MKIIIIKKIMIINPSKKSNKNKYIKIYKNKKNLIII